ncbi:MAG: hypothetical protein IBX41_08685 [Methanophagales archaeon]|nr:hypothetical protein [Methanophagales archaeon]
MKMEILDKIVKEEGIEKEELISLSLLTYLMEKKRKCMEDRLEILKRYGVASAEELENKIKEGAVKEHPAWEDLIAVENLEARIKEIEDDIRNLQRTL